jgi:hypothetical protein
VAVRREAFDHLGLDCSRDAPDANYVAARQRRESEIQRVQSGIIASQATRTGAKHDVSCQRRCRRSDLGRRRTVYRVLAGGVGRHNLPEVGSFESAAKGREPGRREPKSCDSDDFQIALVAGSGPECITVKVNVIAHEVHDGMSTGAIVIAGRQRSELFGAEG